jgi:WD40 repeat protein
MRLDQPGLRPVAFDRGLRWLAFADGNEVMLRRLGGARAPDLRLSRHAVRVREVVFDPEARRLLSLDESGLFCLWSVGEGRLLRDLRTTPPHRYSLPLFSADGTKVVWTTGDGSTLTWNLDAPAAAPPAALRRTDVRDAGGEAFDPTGRWLVSAGWDSVAFWPRGAPRVLALPGHVEGPVLDLAFSLDSSTLASCARDGARLWPLDAERGAGRRVSLGEDFYCYGVRFAPDGRHMAVSSPYAGVFLVPLDGGEPRRVVDYRGSRSAPMPIAFDEAGRTVAVAPMFVADGETAPLVVADLHDGTRHDYPLREPGVEYQDGYAASANYLKYQADGRLLIAGGNGIRRWDPRSGAIQKVMWGHRFAALDASRRGDVVVALVGTLSASRLRLFDPELVVLDPEGRVVRRIEGHGHALTPTLALDPSGRILATGDANGVVRVGPVAGGEPHLLLGHSGPISRVAIAPDGRWVASASGNEVRLWPMPDVSRPPLHTLPQGLLLSTLRSLTNLRVVRDPLSATGWSTQVGPFPGWGEVPSW